MFTGPASNQHLWQVQENHLLFLPGKIEMQSTFCKHVNYEELRYNVIQQALQWDNDFCNLNTRNKLCFLMSINICVQHVTKAVGKLFSRRKLGVSK